MYRSIDDNGSSNRMIEYSDFLWYRIPGQKKVRKGGGFTLLGANETPTGFVISDFHGEDVFQFVENGGDGGYCNHPDPIETKRSEYAKSAKAYIEYLKANGGKAVLSRIKKTELPRDREVYFDALCEAYPNAFVYLIFSTKIGSWIGATPETLVASENGVGSTMALAGTRKTSEDSPWTKKEFEEQALVADFIESNLKEMNIGKVIRSQREEKVSGPVKHLHTAFSFDLPKGKEWELAKKLHPTPAVSGWPVKEAVELIASQERHDRKFYAGIIGVLGEQTKLYVNLRCAELGQNGMYLYLGGGFTKDSVSEDEWIETENKAATLINVLKNG